MEKKYQKATQPRVLPNHRSQMSTMSPQYRFLHHAHSDAKGGKQTFAAHCSSGRFAQRVYFAKLEGARPSYGQLHPTLWLSLPDKLLSLKKVVFLEVSRQGKPTDNAFIEIVNGKFRARG